MYAVIETGGKQYKVAEGDTLFIEKLEAGEVPPSLAPLIKLTRALGVRLGTLMDDDETYGPAYISTDQMEEVERVKSLQTAKDAGDLSYFSLAAAVPPVIWIRSSSP